MMTLQAIWAVARNTLAQAIRVRVGFVIMALYLFLVPALPFFVQGDGTLAGLLHVVIGYSLIVAGTLLGVLTLALSTTTLWTEFRDKQIFLLESRPIRRWQVLLGKLLGILILNGALLAFMGVVTWGSAHYLAGQKRWTRRDRVRADEQVLIARRAVEPDPVPESEVGGFVAQQLDGVCKQLEREGKMPPGGRDEVARTLRAEYFKMLSAVRPLTGRMWRFSGLHIPRRRDVNITIRFKYFSSDTKTEEPDHVRWEFGTQRSVQPGAARPLVYALNGTFMPDEQREIQIPSDAIDEDGVLEVRFINLEPRRPTLIFPEKEAMQVLIPVGSFAPNLVRGMAIIFVEVLFLAVLGLCCSTFMGFPVSPIVALSVLLLIYLSASLKSQFEKGLTFDQNRDSQTALIAEKAARAVTAAVHFVLPPFDKYAPSSLVSSGEEVSWRMLLEATGLIGLLYGGVLILVGSLIFERRELALATR